MKILDKKTLWEGRFLRTTLIRYSESTGCDRTSAGDKNVRQWESVERVNCSGIVAIVPFTDKNEVIMIRQFRPPVNGYVIELPAGLCNPGEPLQKAAERELVEETGYSADSMNFLVKGPISSGSSAEMLNVFVATGLRYIGIGERDETEDMEVLKVPLDSLNARLSELRDEGNYMDLKVSGLIEMAQKTLR